MTSLNVYVDYDDPLVAELIRNTLSQLTPNANYTFATEASLQWSSYESIAFETILENPQTLCNSYIFRKALIRKHFLANTVQTWLSKHPESILGKSTPKTYLLECDYSDYLDEALNESYELREALEESENERRYFILKPSMADRGQGIRLFSTREELEQIFEEFDVDSDEEEEDGDTGVMASQLRHFVVQEYVSRPLLLQSVRRGRKFHIRAYVVAFGAIKVWLWSEMLALFAGEMYAPPSSTSELGAHLTNTCLQDGPDKDDNVLRFWSLPLPQEVLQQIFTRISLVTGEIFVAAAAGQQMHFQTLPNVFEIFGVDFLVDEDVNVYLLEINSFPDFKQTGQQLTDHVVGGLFQEVTKQIICPFFNLEPKSHDLKTEWKRGHLELVKEIELRGKW